MSLFFTNIDHSRTFTWYKEEEYNYLNFNFCIISNHTSIYQMYKFMPLNINLWFRTLLHIWVTRRVSYKKKELITSREHLVWPPVFFSGVRVSLFSFLFAFLCFVSLCPLSSVSNGASFSGLSIRVSFSLF